MRYIIKSLTVFAFICILGRATTNAYQMSHHDTDLVWDLNGNVDRAIQQSNRSTGFMQTLATQLSVSIDQVAGDDRKQVIMQQIFQHVHNELTLSEDGDMHSFIQNFVATYATGLQGDDFPAALKPCIDKFDMVDTYARQADVPTALILATWFEESSCRQINPDNGQGLFQIVSNYYTPGSIDNATIADEITDFIGFARNKRGWYEKVNNQFLDISYSHWDMKSIQTQ